MPTPTKSLAGDATYRLARTFLWLRDHETTLADIDVPTVLSETGLGRDLQDRRTLYVLSAAALSKRLNACAVDLAYESHRRGLPDAIIFGGFADSAITFGGRPGICQSDEFNAIISAARADK